MSRGQQERRKRADLARLKGAIARLERVPARLEGRAGAETAPFSVGLDAIDERIAGTDFRHQVHEVCPTGFSDGAAARGFCLGLVARLYDATPAPGPVLWCQSALTVLDYGRPYGQGLGDLGLGPRHFLFAALAREDDVLWALEEGLKARALAAVIGDVSRAGLTESRRLALAAAASGIPCFLIRPFCERMASAAATRWRVTARPSAAPARDARAPGRARWQVDLTRNRGGRLGSFDIEWNHETRRFHLAETLADRAADARRNPGDWEQADQLRLSA
ncbi:MAG: hypothetical protein MI755_19975 [Sphingomonadales bacterium]|nr:hypothetical protein [Sphingomonadales bacterium]